MPSVLGNTTLSSEVALPSDIETEVLNRVNFLHSKQTAVLDDPATLVLDPQVGVYYFNIGSDGALPTLDRTNLPVDSTDIRVYHFTLHFQVDSSATTLSSSGITWVSGAGLPTTEFAGHWIEASIWMEMWSNTVVGAVWRVS